MKVTENVHRTYTCELSEKEAHLLHDLLQNPLPRSPLDGDEISPVRELREGMFKPLHHLLYPETKGNY